MWWLTASSPFGSGTEERSMTVFMDHMTFYLIGYAESYTDCTQHN
jgi:hypothetical protein